MRAMKTTLLSTASVLWLTPALADPRLQDFPDRTFTCKSDEGKYAKVEVHTAQALMIIDEGNGPKRYRITGFSAPINPHVTDEFGFVPKTPVFDLTVIFGGENGGFPELQEEGPERWGLIMKRPATSYTGVGTHVFRTRALYGGRAASEADRQAG
jgi:hypothetical protein